MDARLLATTPCYLNGRYLPLSDATIHPLDRGFLFGDGVYEVIKIVAGVPLFVDEHLARLADGLDAVAIRLPGGVAGAAAVIAELVERAGATTGSVYFQVTRGAEPRSRIPSPDLEPTVVAWATSHPLAEHGSNPLRAVTMDDIRWGRCDVKTTSLIGAVLGKLRAADAGVDEVVFVGPEGDVREGGSTSVFVRCEGTLVTHPAGRSILPGVTRRLVLELAAEAGLEVRETAPRLADRERWQELIVCGTNTGVQGVVELDGTPIGDGAVGDQTRAIATAMNDRETAEANARR